ncbi:hypothetical protein RF11_01127 [Thelohanellus kitauei]|uniref:Uncharacterized protein n=1 Tax=Thelohanellus kitauei TaxID=669202 RepID=A0A0C2J591_THEKT|nr:hypothetical protein RF11_01127 [Thelohanellus kitauei]
MKEQYSALEIIPDNVNKFSSTDYLKIKAKLYSTRFTYNPDVYILKELKPGTKIPNIDKIVFRFCSVETAEIVKFIQPLFQSIVGMMVPSDNYRDDCIYFQAFV